MSSRFSPPGLRIALALALLFGLLGVAATAQTELHWKLKPGERLHYQVRSKIANVINMMGREMETDMTQVTDVAWDVKAVDEAGIFTIEQTVTRIRMNMESPMMEFEFDTAGDDDPEGAPREVLRPLKKMVGAKAVLKMDRYGKVTDMKLPKELTQVLKESAGGQFAAPLRADKLKQLVGVGIQFPRDGLTEGQKWSHKASTDMPFGKMMTEHHFEYLGVETKGNLQLAKIGLHPKMELEASDDSPMPVDMSDMESKGTAWFDPASGRLVMIEMKTSMTMEMEMQGNFMEQQIKQSMNMKLVEPKKAGEKPTEKKPVEEKPVEKKPAEGK